MTNVLISAGVGVVLALAGVVGGVAAIQGDPQGVSQSTLYNYADE